MNIVDIVEIVICCFPLICYFLYSIYGTYMANKMARKNRELIQEIRNQINLQKIYIDKYRKEQTEE